jgi:hypothetical protein
MFFRRQRQRYARDKEALSKILAEELPPTADALPLTIEFGRGRLVWLIVGLIGGVVLFTFVDLASQDSTFSLMLAMAVVLIHVSAFVADPTLLDVSVAVSGEGVRSKRWLGEKLISWWEKPAISATKDITTIVIQAGSRVIRVRLDKQPAEKRVDFMQAVRAWARQYDYDVVEGPVPRQYARAAASTALGLAGVAILLAGVWFFSPGNSLGIRCSTNGAYFQELFGTPATQGCTILRVSAGAKQAGVRQGDLLIELNGIPITSGTQFSNVFDALSKTEFVVKVIRGGQTLDFNVGLGRSQTFPEDMNDPIFVYLRARGEANGDPEAAIADYGRAIDLAPKFDLAYLYRAQLYGEAGDNQSASADFLKAVELSPSLGEAYRLLGQHQRATGDLLSASTNAHKAIDFDKCDGAFEEYNVDCAEDYYLLGTLQAGYYDVQEPIANAEEAIRFWPSAVEAYCLLATLFERAGDNATAAGYARTYLDFPEGDRFPECEPDAKRVRDLGESTAGNGSATLTAAPKRLTAPTQSPGLAASGIGSCIDFDSHASCPPR